MTEVSRVPKYIEIATHLRIFIERQGLKRGAQLPSEAELCQRFGCSRGPVRQAVDMLVREGEVRRQQGAGTFVAERGAPADRQRKVLAAIVPNLENAAFTRAIRALTIAADAKGHTVFLGVTQDSVAIERQFLDQSAALQVRGVVKFPTSIAVEEEVRESLRRYGLPYVIVNDFWTPSQDDYLVSCSERAAIDLAIEHLVELGHERIGLVETNFWTRERAIHAFFRALERRGLPHDKEQLLLFDAGSEAPPVEKLYGPGGAQPTALLTLYDVFAGLLITQLRKYELRVPEDVSVVNLNGRPLEQAAGMDLTTTLPPYEKMMAQALNLLIGGMGVFTSLQ